MNISGTTRIVGLIGDPVTFSRSPALHNAAYEALELDIAYVVFPVAPGRVDEAVQGAGALSVLGLSVTLPHKEAVVGLADWRSADVERLGAANTLVWRDGRLEAHTTDGAGFTNALAIEHDFSVKERRCVLLGAGGSARAIALSLANSGAADVAILNRTPTRSTEAAQRIGGVSRVGTTDDLAHADLIINATPLGMPAHPGIPISVDTLSPDTFVVDIIYAPQQTALLEAAAMRGCRTANGFGMLIHQAAAQVELWTGLRPDTAIMRSALSSQ